METPNALRQAFLEYLKAEEEKKWDRESPAREAVCVEKWKTLERLLRDPISKT